jgi:hypothetical protein
MGVQGSNPTLVPKWLRNSVLFFMKEGDPQQHNEIQDAMKNICINASEGTCGFHVVNMGWKKHVPTCTGIFTQFATQEVVQHCFSDS